MFPHCLNQALLSKILSRFIERVGYSIRVECERVSRKELGFVQQAVPFREEAQNRGGGIQTLKRAITAKQKPWVVPAIGIAHTPGGIVIFGKYKSGISAVGRVFVKKLVYRLQKALRLVRRDHALAPQVRL